MAVLVNGTVDSQFTCSTLACEFWYFEIYYSATASECIIDL